MKIVKYKINAFLIILFLLSSCKDEEQIRRESLPEGPKILKKDSEYYDQNYRIYELNGCEYIVVNYGNQQWGSHKGDCKNPIHNCPCDTAGSN
jgi:hypothetical protein